MKILTVRDYNAEDERRWHERVAEWKNDRQHNNIIPQIAFIGFRTQTGEMRQTGYVAVSDDFGSAYYGKTKREAERKWVTNKIPQ